jgi:CDP-6-deoxy-D-xylo-4-hexulose-3-dehydrase
MFPILINAGSSIVRSELQQWMESHGVDTRMVSTGNVTRQPMLRGRQFRVPATGLPNADHVMEHGLILPNSHSLNDDDCHYIAECLQGFVTSKNLG